MQYLNFPCKNHYTSRPPVSLKPSSTRWGSWARKPFCVPRFLIIGNRFIQLPSFPESQGHVQTVAHQGREGMQRQGRNSQETIVQPWDRVLVPPQGIHITISLSYLTGTETPIKWEKLTVCCPQSRRPQTI